MSRGQKTIIALMILNIAVSCVFIAILPDTVPVHYDFAGQIDRMGSKYELLLFPGFSVLLGAFMIWSSEKLSSEPGERKALVITGIVIELMFGLLGVFFMCKAMTNSPIYTGINLSADVICTVVTAVLGVIIALFGLVMPKVGRNSFFGLRTGWALSCDEVWTECQRFGGAGAIVTGLLVIVCSFAFSGLTGVYVSLGLLMLWSVVCIIASKVIYDRHSADGQEKSNE